MSDFTLELRLCDDTGMVSDEPVPPGSPGTLVSPDLTYRKLLNNLKARNGNPDTRTPYEGEPFACTGSAHLAGEHIRCTSPAHARPSEPSAFVAPVDEIDPISPPEGLVGVLIRRPEPGPTAGMVMDIEVAMAMEALGIGYGDELLISRGRPGR